MTGLAKSAKRATWLRISRATAIAGLLGLFVAAFLPEYVAGTRNVVPAEWILKALTWSQPSYPMGTIAVFGAYLYAPVLLILSCAGLLVRGDRARAAVGWCASLACLVVFLVVATEIWRIRGPRWLSLSLRMTREFTLLSWLMVTGTAGLATALLGFAPARLRLAGCVGIVGWWALSSFPLIYGLLKPWYGPYSVYPASGFSVALLSSALIAAGGTAETVLLWRAGDSAEETP